MHYIVSYIRGSAINYKAYKEWTTGNVQSRQFFMALHRKDWECAAALYKNQRRNEMKLRYDK